MSLSLLDCLLMKFENRNANLQLKNCILSNPGVTDLLPVKSEKLKDQTSALKA